MQRLISPIKVFGFGRKTAAAGTAIVQNIEPLKRPNSRQARTRITGIQYSCGATAHTLTIMRPLGRTTLSSGAASGQSVINLIADPGGNAGGIAANDRVCLEMSDGTFFFTTVASVSSLAITLASNLSVNASNGARLWFFGVVADGHFQHPLLANAIAVLDETTFGRDNIGMIESTDRYDPMIVLIDNLTDAGVLECVTGCYDNL